MKEEGKKKTRKIVQRFTERMYTYSQELIVCGKVGCTKCPHGPYWYVRWKQGDRIVTRYIGKVLRLIRCRGEAGKNSDEVVGDSGGIGGGKNPVGGGYPQSNCG